jgi:hypothetical protein
LTNYITYGQIINIYKDKDIPFPVSKDLQKRIFIIRIYQDLELNIDLLNNQNWLLEKKIDNTKKYCIGMSR